MEYHSEMNAADYGLMMRPIIKPSLGKSPDKIKDNIKTVLSKWFHAKPIILSNTLNPTEHDVAAGVYRYWGADYGTYTVDFDEIYDLLRFALRKTLSKSVVADVLLDICRDTKAYAYRCRDRNLSAVNNGLFWYKMQMLIPFTPKYIFLSKTHIDFVKNPALPKFRRADGTDTDIEQLIADTADGNARKTTFLWRILGAAIRPTTPWRETIFITGEGATGKSTFVNIVQNLTGAKHSTMTVDTAKSVSKRPHVLFTNTALCGENDYVRRASKAYKDKLSTLTDIIDGKTIPFTANKRNTPDRGSFMGIAAQTTPSPDIIKRAQHGIHGNRVIIVPFTHQVPSDRIEHMLKYDYIGRKDTLEYIQHKVLMMKTYYPLKPSADCTVLT